MSRKRRTRQHVIEEMGVNFLERQVLRRAHQLQRPSLREYGWDAAMFHFSPDEQIENGEVRFQVKATDNLNIAGDTIRCRVETADLHYWYWDEFPFVLVVYDAQRHRAFWLDVQSYVEQHPQALSPGRKTVTVKIPVANSVNLRAVDRWREWSLSRT